MGTPAVHGQKTEQRDGHRGECITRAAVQGRSSELLHGTILGSRLVTSSKALPWLRQSPQTFEVVLGALLARLDGGVITGVHGFAEHHQGLFGYVAAVAGDPFVVPVDGAAPTSMNDHGVRVREYPPQHGCADFMWKTMYMNVKVNVAVVVAALFVGCSALC
jgi:hypothetical protein